MQALLLLKAARSNKLETDEAELRASAHLQLWSARSATRLWRVLALAVAWLGPLPFGCWRHTLSVWCNSTLFEPAGPQRPQARHGNVRERRRERLLRDAVLLTTALTACEAMGVSGGSAFGVSEVGQRWHSAMKLHQALVADGLILRLVKT